MWGGKDQVKETYVRNIKVRPTLTFKYEDVYKHCCLLTFLCLLGTCSALYVFFVASVSLWLESPALLWVALINLYKWQLENFIHRSSFDSLFHVLDLIYRLRIFPCVWMVWIKPPLVLFRDSILWTKSDGHTDIPRYHCHSFFTSPTLSSIYAYIQSGSWKRKKINLKLTNLGYTHGLLYST